MPKFIVLVTFNGVHNRCLAPGILVSARLWDLLMKVGGEKNSTSHQTSIPSVPDLVRNEALAALAALAVVCIISALLDAPAEGPSDPSGLPAQTVKAPWIFLGIQQLLRYLPTLFAGIVLPLSAIVGLAAIPWIPAAKKWPATLLFFAIILASGILTLWGQIR